MTQDNGLEGPEKPSLTEEQIVDRLFTAAALAARRAGGDQKVVDAILNLRDHYDQYR